MFAAVLSPIRQLLPEVMACHQLSNQRIPVGWNAPLSTPQNRTLSVSFLKETSAQRRNRTHGIGETSEEAPEMVRRYTQFRQTMAAAVVEVEAEVFEKAASNLKPGSKRRATDATDQRTIQ